jgi:hypothetical protein
MTELKELEEKSPFNNEGLEWLELKNIPNEVYNPLLDYELNKQKDPIQEVVEFMCNPSYLHYAAKQLLGVELMPFQLVILDTLWRKRLPMLIASRGAGKSFMLSVYALLRMIFHPGCKVVIVGAAFRQSRQVFEYMVNIWERSPMLQDICGKGKTVGPRREIDRCQFNLGNSVTYAVPLGNGEKIRGLRANYILADEMASIPAEVFNLVVQGFGVVAAAPLDKVKEASMVKKLKEMGAWNEELEKLRRLKVGGNQIVYSGTAYYAFNHFAQYFKKWHTIISSKGDPEKLKIVLGDDGIQEGFDWKDYAILRIPYTHLPDGLLDPGILAQAKTTLHHNQFLMEYGSFFPSDSDGFYKRSIIESATTNKPILTSGGKKIQFSALRHGEKDRAYIMGVDPAADKDNAAIVLIELNDDHRKIVHCWTTNRKKYAKFKKYMKESGNELDDDYYRYIAKKIRGLMRAFNIERIVMDRYGGGIAVSEALSSKDTCDKNETPVFEIIDPENPKSTDMEQGVHILELVTPTNELNSDANHGMLKDLQDKILLFPMFDTIEMERAIALDAENEFKFDTYEDLIQEIEELKNEMTTIVVLESSALGKERFDTPEVKTEGSKKGHLRKDRFSALLYANYYARSKNKNDALKMEYKAVGGTKDTIKKVTVKKDQESMYSGPGILKFSNSHHWLKNPGYTAYRRR